jgi:hypothetical protein
MVRGLVVGLLMLAALVAVASAGTVKALPGAAFAQLPETIAAASDRRQPSLQEVVSPYRDTGRPCDRAGATPDLARCPTVQCITVCGGLPITMVAIPSPPRGSDTHASVTDDPSRGISTIPDLPPPRPSA